jgi:hypothetical protein
VQKRIFVLLGRPCLSYYYDLLTLFQFVPALGTGGARWLGFGRASPWNVLAFIQTGPAPVLFQVYSRAGPSLLVLRQEQLSRIKSPFIHYPFLHALI